MTYPPEPVTTDPDETTAVICTGLTATPRCIVNYDALAKQIVTALVPIHETLQQRDKRLRHVVIGGPPAIANAVDEFTTNPVAVSSHFRDPARYLDDTTETGPHGTIPSVKQDHPPVGELLADAGKLPTDPDEFDLSEPADRARVTGDIQRELAPGRYQRAHEKAQSCQFEHLMGEWFTAAPTADHVVVVSDTQTEPTHVSQHVLEETSPWVKYPTGPPGCRRRARLGEGDLDDVVSWNLAGVFDPRHQKHVPYHEFSPRERRCLNEWLTTRTREDLGYPFQGASPAAGDTGRDQDAPA